jgi:hypothetical protein
MGLEQPFGHDLSRRTFMTSCPINPVLLPSFFRFVQFVYCKQTRRFRKQNRAATKLLNIAQRAQAVTKHSSRSVLENVLDAPEETGKQTGKLNRYVHTASYTLPGMQIIFGQPTQLTHIVPK